MRLNLNVLLRKLDFFLETRVSALSGKHKLLIVLAVWLLPITVFTFLFLMPKMEEIDQLQDRIDVLTIQTLRLQGIARELDRHRAQMAEVEERLRLASLLLPEEREIPHLLTSISILGTVSGLDFLLFRPQPEVLREFYAEIPIEIAVRGSYHDVGVFLDQVSKLPRIVTAHNLRMGSPTRSGGIMELTSTITLLTYRFIKPLPQP